jgi:hypothetical protein
MSGKYQLKVSALGPYLKYKYLSRYKFTKCTQFPIWTGDQQLLLPLQCDFIFPSPTHNFKFKFKLKLKFNFT